MAAITMRPIGYVKSPFAEVSQIPKGCGAQHDAEGVLDILPEFAAGLTDIDGFSHLYVFWIFDRLKDDEYELVSKPPTDTREHGVFASRSPRRPNHIGLTVVRLLGRDGATLRVGGVDMLDGTPILDIKPYMSNVPAETLKRGWLADAEAAKSRDHWENVYRTKATTDVSWYAPHLEDSILAITEFTTPASRVIDVGGGASTLVDDLLDRGYTDVTVLDISAQALDVARRRLGPRASVVHWLSDSVTSADLGDRPFDLWHDRAVFHFLTDPTQRAAYVAQVRRHVASGGVVVISAFSRLGPIKCSGLNVVQYDAASLARELGDGFAFIDAADVVHVTPNGQEQRFVRCRFRRR